MRPKITVEGYDGLRVVVPSPDVTDDEVSEQLDRLRRQSASLQEAKRPAIDGDHVTIDIAGSLGGEPVEGLTVDDYLYEVGSGTAVPELDDHLRGGKVGDILVFDATHPDPEEDRSLSFRVLVKEIQEPVLPDADDAWAAEVSEFETVDELTVDLRGRLESIKRMQTALAVRRTTIDELVKLVDDEPPSVMVENEVERRLQDLAHRLSHEGATIEQYLEATGTDAQELINGLREESLQAVKADLAVRAVIDAEGIEADEESVDAEIAGLAAQVGRPVEEARAQLERGGQLTAIRSDVQRRKALDWLVERADLVDENGGVVDRSVLDAFSADALPDEHHDHDHDHHDHDHDEHDHDEEHA